MTLTYENFTLKFTLDDGTSRVYKVQDPESLENQLFTYMSILDDPSASYVSTIDGITAKLKEIEDKIEDLKRTNVIEETVVQGEPLNLNDTSADYNVSGDIDTTSSVICKSLYLKDSSIIASKVTISASDEVRISDLDIAGEFAAEGKDNIVNVDDSLYVDISGVRVDSTNQYNGLYIAHNSRTKLQPKSVTISNCDLFNFRHHPIVIDSVQEGTTITISNCNFEGCFEENFRWSNSKNVSGVTINFLNCAFSTKNANVESKPYCGFILLHDWVSPAGGSEEANLFSPDKLMINFVGCTYNGKNFTKEDVVMGNGEPNQTLYVYSTKDGFIDYDEKRYPIVNVTSN